MMLLEKNVYNANIKDIEDITNLPSTAAFNAKINEVKNKIANTSNLATTTSLTAVENTIPPHSKYITITEANLALAQANTTTSKLSKQK